MFKLKKIKFSFLFRLILSALVIFSAFETNAKTVVTGITPTTYKKISVACGFGPTSKPAKTFFVTRYGAVPNDGLDDRATIQAAINAANAAGGGIVYFPPGEYQLSLDTSYSENFRHALRVYKNLHFFGSENPETPSVLKLMNNQGSYKAVFLNVTEPGWPEGYRADVSNVWFAHLTINQNSSNNLVYEGDLSLRAAILIAPQLSWKSNFGVVHSRFLNSKSGDVVAFTAYSRDQCVANNEFRNISGCVLYPGDGTISPLSCSEAKYDGEACEDKICKDVDHSTIYIDGEGDRYHPVIKNNTFIAGDEIGLAGARTAIETHGNGFEVSGNVIENYGNGMNITNINFLIPSSKEAQIVKENEITGAQNGIVLWSGKYDNCAYGNDFYFADRFPNNPPPADPANPCPNYNPATEPMRFSVELRQNRIFLDPVSWRLAGKTSTSTGININRNNDLNWAPYSTVTIADNHIEYPAKVFPAPYALDANNETHKVMEWYSAGISLYHPFGGKFDKVEISGNTVLNPLGNGLYVYTSIDDLSISENTFTNPGSSHFQALRPNPALASGMYLAGGLLGQIPLIRVENNCFRDDQAQRTLGYGVAENNIIDTLGCSLSGTCTIVGNNYELPLIGGTVTDLLKQQNWNYTQGTPGCSEP